MTTDNQRILLIPLDRIKVDGNQPRKTFNEQSLRELADSIERVGLLQPITVRENDDNTYTVLEGERRLKAYQMRGIRKIKAILAEGDEGEIADRRLAENVVRENLSVLELAREFERRTIIGQTQEQIAAVVGKSRVYVAQRLALLRLPEEQLKQLEEGKITFTEARTLANQHSNAVTLESLKATLPLPVCICLTCENYRDCYG